MADTKKDKATVGEKATIETDKIKAAVANDPELLKATTAKSGGTSTMGSTTTKKTSKYTEVTFTKAAAAKLTAAEKFDAIKGRISQERALLVLITLVDAGRVKLSKAPGVVMAWTYKRVVVEGIAYEGLGKKVPEVSFTQDAFAKLTFKEMAEAITGRISVEKAKDIMIALLEPAENGKAIVDLSPTELVRFSNNRIAVAGISPEWNHGVNGSGATKQPVSIAGVSA